MKRALSEEPDKLATTEIVTSEELVDAIWAAIQRPSPAITRNEVSALFDAWQGDYPVVKDNRQRQCIDHIAWADRQLGLLESDPSERSAERLAEMRAGYKRQIRACAQEFVRRMASLGGGK